MISRDYNGIRGAERRDSGREEVFYRTRATLPGRSPIAIQIVDISATGFMARTDADLAAGDQFTVRLSALGEVQTDVRWALGGRIGCQFTRMIEIAPYLELIGTLMKETR